MRILVGIIWVALSGASFITVVAAGKVVKASFIWDTEYTSSLGNPESPAYTALKNSVQTAVNDVQTSSVISCTVESFRDGSDRVIVDLSCSTTKLTWKAANRQVLATLNKVPDPPLDTKSISLGVRLCLPGQGKCTAAMIDEIKNSENPTVNIICIEGRDRYDCLQRLNNGKVDLVRADPADVYLAADLYRGNLRVVAEARDTSGEDTYRYRAVAVVRRSTIKRLDDLKGSKSCHTGYGKTSGWYVPISKLLENGQMSPNCSATASVVENDLRTVSSYISQACIPGKWVPDDETNKRLKEKYSNLCSLCDDPATCSKNDAHAGYKGALKCLIDEDADVAWTKLDEVHEFFNEPNNNVNKTEFGLLLYDGTIVNIDYSVSHDSPRPGWAARPWPVWLTWRWHNSVTGGPGLYRTIRDLAKIANGKGWEEDVLGKKTSYIEKMQPRPFPYDYLQNAGYYTTISQVGCNGDNVRLCVDGKAQEKCSQLADVLKSRRVRPNLACVVESDENKCVDAIKSGTADIVTLDGAHMLTTYSDYPNIIPVISEVYGTTKVNYFAVAVVKSDSGITSLAGLNGRKSCHTGMGKSAGWYVPVETLIEEGFLTRDNCNYPEQMGKFFSQSCVPGANNTKYNPNPASSPSLCDLCIGNDADQYVCARNKSERYYDYSGAFRCLVADAGDVAFIKHTTVLANTGLTDNEPGDWNHDLNANDYRLLCRDNSTQHVSAYESCNWARVPSHKVVTRNDTNGVLQEEIRILLLRASETLPLTKDIFAMFGPFGKVRDLIFKSSATSLENLSEHEFDEILEGTYYKAITQLHNCTA